MLHSLLLWLAQAESQRYMVNIHDLNVDINMLQEHRDTLKVCESTDYLIKAAVLIVNMINRPVFI